MDKVSMGDVSGPCDWVAIASLQPAYIEVKSGRLHLRRSDEETHREDALLANGSLCTATPRFSAPFLKCRALLTQRPDLRSGLCKPWLYLFTCELKYWKEILCFQISNIERKYFVSISIIEISNCVATSNIERKYSVHNLKYQKLRKYENMNFLWCLVRFSPACLSLRIPEEQIRICSYCLQDLVDDYRAERQYDWYLPGAARSNYIHPIVTFWCV